MANATQKGQKDAIGGLGKLRYAGSELTFKIYLARILSGEAAWDEEKKVTLRKEILRKQILIFECEGNYI